MRPAPRQRREPPVCPLAAAETIIAPHAVMPIAEPARKTPVGLWRSGGVRGRVVSRRTFGYMVCV